MPTYFSCDVEADGQVPGINSMVCFGAIIVEPSLTKTFYGQTKPISKMWVPEALAISGFTRKEHEKFEDPAKTMMEFFDWVKINSKGNPIFITDNPAFDFAYMNYYFHVYCGSNPFGYSARRIGDLFCGFYNDMYYKWKRHRVTHHNHNPVADSMGNAEALLYLQSQGLKIKLV